MMRFAFFNKEIPWIPISSHSGPPSYIRGSSHLDQADFSYVMGPGNGVRIRVIYSSHCFTRAKQPGDPADLDYTLHHTDPRTFCVDRHFLSLQLNEVLLKSLGGKVEMCPGGNYVSVTLRTMNGLPIHYAVFFDINIDVRNRPDLLIRVRSAHPRAQRPTTRGHVRFGNLIQLTLSGKRPRQIFGAKHRK